MKALSSKPNQRLPTKIDAQSGPRHKVRLRQPRPLCRDGSGVGVKKNVCVAVDRWILVMLNPRITKEAGPYETGREGCLSQPQARRKNDSYQTIKWPTPTRAAEAYGDFHRLHGASRPTWDRPFKMGAYIKYLPSVRFLRIVTDFHRSDNGERGSGLKSLPLKPQRGVQNNSTLSY